MKIHIANYSEQNVGGGWSWIDNFISGAKRVNPNVSFVDYQEAWYYLIPSASMAQREQVKQAKADGKKIILRVDNALRHSRNRSTGMSRLKDFADMADVVIYQSLWAREIIGGDFLGKGGAVILNGVDHDVFNSQGRIESTDMRYTYSRYNRDETKNWEVARYTYQGESLLHGGKTILNIIGRFSPELVENNFDFYMNEKYKFWGVQPPAVIADILRNTDYLIYTFFNDACSNTLIEAISCDCEVLDLYGHTKTGGASDIIDTYNQRGVQYFSHLRMAREYLEVIGGV